MKLSPTLTAATAALTLAGCAENSSPVAPQAATDVPVPVSAEAAAAVADAPAPSRPDAPPASADTPASPDVPEPVDAQAAAEAAAEARAAGEGPRFIPYDRQPVLQNRRDVSRRLRELYPPLLREAGVGGVVNVWLYISEEGDVRDARVNRSSGVDELDAAATTLARDMVFLPAAHKDEPVGVWISIPITFAVGG